MKTKMLSNLSCCRLIFVKSRGAAKSVVGNAGTWHKQQKNQKVFIVIQKQKPLKNVQIFAKTQKSLKHFIVTQKIGIFTFLVFSIFYISYSKLKQLTKIFKMFSLVIYLLCIYPEKFLYSPKHQSVFNFLHVE